MLAAAEDARAAFATPCNAALSKHLLFTLTHAQLYASTCSINAPIARARIDAARRDWPQLAPQWDGRARELLATTR